MSERGVGSSSFWESQNYYSRLGVPCGHPRRYDSSNVVRLPSDSRTKLTNKYDQNTKTEGEQQIKYLAQKQLDTKLTKEQYMSHQRTFVEKVLYKPKTAELKGICSLDSFNKIQKQDEELEFLRQCGLSEDEICLKKEHDSAAEEIPAQKRSRYGMNPSVQKEIIQNINEKINEKKANSKIPNSFNGARNISRLRMELENAVRTPNKTSLMNCLITTNTKDTNVCEEHPINQLKDISDSLLTKKRKIHSPIKNGTFDKTETDDTEIKSENIWKGVETLPEENHTVNHVSSSDENSKSNSLGLTHIEDEVQPISKELISKNCISTEEILLISRFKEYHPGEKNNTLYLKNLSKKVTEYDLIKLFLHFQTEKFPIQYKLLSGKMRGQAFITFETAHIAEEALELVNGYVLKGKPIIIQYGKRQF